MVRTLARQFIKRMYGGGRVGGLADFGRMAVGRWGGGVVGRWNIATYLNLRIVSKSTFK